MGAAELASQALRRPRFQVLLVGAFAVLALVLGAVGIFGVVLVRDCATHA